MNYEPTDYRHNGRGSMGAIIKSSRRRVIAPRCVRRRCTVGFSSLPPARGVGTPICTRMQLGIETHPAWRENELHGHVLVEIPPALRSAGLTTLAGSGPVATPEAAL